MSGGDWIGDFVGGWPDPAPQQTPPPAAPSARETVEIVVCPKCRKRVVRCTKRQATHSSWTCDACFHGWKEGPEVGGSKGFVA